MVWRIFLLRVRLGKYDCCLVALLYTAVEGRLGANPLHCKWQVQFFIYLEEDYVQLVLRVTCRVHLLHCA